MRFNATGNSTSATISTLDLFNLLVVLLGAGTGYPIIAALRLRRVRIFAIQQSIGTSAYASIEFSISNSPGNVGVKPTVYSDTSLSAAYPAYVDQKPPPHSACSMWQFRPASASTGGTAIILNYTSKAVIDIVMDYVLQNGETPPTPVTTAVGVSGQLALNALDNTTNNDLVPSPEYVSAV